MILEYMKAPLHKYTFSIKPIREWVEKNSTGLTLNLFSGPTKLNIHEIRNDIDINMPAEYHIDAADLVNYNYFYPNTFDTIILDPPYSYRKSMEMYNGHKASRFNQLKDSINKILKPGGKVITFGYHSVSMGKSREFVQEKILLISHGGAIHDTIATVEIYIPGRVNHVGE